MSTTIAPIRTRFAVIVDRFNAGLPFYYEPTADERHALTQPGCTFLGQPVVIIDQDDTHYVLQRAENQEEAA
jgi:hypothetical protein